MEIIVLEIQDSGEINEFQISLIQNQHWNSQVFSGEPAVREDNIDGELGESSNNAIFKAVFEGKMIGWISAYQQNETCIIEQLLVHPKFRRAGAGERLVATIEESFADCLRFETRIKHFNGVGFCFFHKMGYHVCRMERLVDTVNVYLEKNNWLFQRLSCM